MIEVFGQVYAFDDPRVILVGGAGFLGLCVLVVLIVTMRRAGRSAVLVESMAAQVGGLSQSVVILGQGQDQLTGRLIGVSEAQLGANALTEARFAEMQQQMADRLHDNAMRSARAVAQMQERLNETLQGSSTRTTKSLTQLQERLATIDRAQDNITKLSGEVLSLQDILSNKQTRGAFGEIQLNDIVSKALPAGSFTMQATLSNGRRADCLIDLPNPPGPIAIDSKFPLEAYEALRAAKDERAVADATRAMRTAVRKHIKDIAERYIIEGETADGALMFLPSEAVYAELHGNFPDVVREGFDARVWIVSPTTCMATLNTMRAILKDARMREQAGAIRKTLRLLHRDVEMVVERVGKLDVHFAQARADLDGIGTAAERAGKRAARLDAFDFEELEPDASNGPSGEGAAHPTPIRGAAPL
ncbi:MAG: DNA recombination protein RmuC [Paracoccaceae bacterium]|jgi:DNA recombination protein RmuC